MMTKRTKALRDKYLPALIGFLLLSVCAQAQVPQKLYGEGYQFKRIMPDTSLAVPSDTMPMRNWEKNVPHLAIKDTVPYIWNVTAQKWQRVITSGSGSTIDTLPLSTRINELVARRDTLSITQSDSLHIIICQIGIGVCDTLEFTAGTSGTAITYPYTARKYLNGYGAFPTLNSDSLDEGGTNLFFTNARVLALFNGTGLVKSTAGTISYITDNSANWNTAYGWGNHATAGYVPQTRAISTTAPLTGGGDLSANRTLGITQATTSTDGYLSSTDWNTFNGKQAALVSGTNIKTINGNSLLGSGDVTISGGTLNNVGTGYDVAVQGTSNVKRLQAGFGVILDSTTTPNTIIAKADTSAGKLATRWYAQNNIGYDTTKVGTYAQRLAITGLYKGYQFFQTNERVGLWVYGNGGWVHYPAEYIMPPTTVQWFSTSVVGSGASAAYNQTMALADTLRPNTVVLQTGTTATGTGGIYSSGGNNVGFAPIDSVSVPSLRTKSRYVLAGRIKLWDAPTSAENYRFKFGFGTQLTDNDSTAYGAYFRFAAHRSANIQLALVSPTGSTVLTAEGPPIASLTGRFIDYVVVVTSQRAWYYIDGQYLGTLQFSGVTTFNASAIVFGITKLAGTTNRYVSLSKCYLYQYTEE